MTTFASFWTCLRLVPRPANISKRFSAFSRRTLRFFPPTGALFSFLSGVALGATLKKLSSRPCCFAPICFVNFSAPLRTRSSLQSLSARRTNTSGRHKLETLVFNQKLYKTLDIRGFPFQLSIDQIVDECMTSTHLQGVRWGDIWLEEEVLCLLPRPVFWNMNPFLFLSFFFSLLPAGLLFPQVLDDFSE